MDSEVSEFMLDVHGVTGSSPVPRTTKNLGTTTVPRFFLLHFTGLALFLALLNHPAETV